MLEFIYFLIPTKLLKLLIVSSILSIIIMIVIQKIKNLSFVKTNNQIWFINFLLSFSIGVPFSIFFYELNIYDGLWISLFSFIGTSGIYLALKKQNIINYSPLSLNDKKIDIIEIPKENFINRGEKL